MQQMTLTEIAAALGAEYHGPDAAITHISTDSRDLPAGSLFIALEGERTDGHRYVPMALRTGAAAAVVQRPVPDLTAEEQARLLVVPNSFYAPLAIAGAYRQRFSPLTVGVTGSVGKTTTKDFIAAVLSARYRTLRSEGNHNNELGLPATVFELDDSVQAAVFEMGMEALGDIRLLTRVARPDIGVITNVGVSHLERLGTRENILAAKLEITEGMADGSPLFLCGDNDLLSTVRIPRLRVLRFGIDGAELDARARDIVTTGQETRFVIDYRGAGYPAAIPAMGRHNAMNATAAFLVGVEAGLAPEQAAAALSRYTISGMRQRIRDWNGVTVVEDCYNAAPDSMHAALDTLAGMPCQGKKICVFADMRELGSASEEGHRSVGRHAARVADRLLVYGPQSHFYLEGAKAGGLAAAAEYPDRPALAAAVRDAARPGDIVWFKGSLLMHLGEVLSAAFPEDETSQEQ